MNMENANPSESQSAPNPRRLGISGEFDPAHQSRQFRLSRGGRGGSSAFHVPEPPSFLTQHPTLAAGPMPYSGPGVAPPLELPEGIKPDTSILLDELLVDAPRKNVNGRMVPVLGGIVLLSRIGQGGMGAVYYGIHSRLDNEVAVKVLPGAVSKRDPSMAQRFIREARLAFSVQSPHLIGVIDINVENGIMYLVMDYVFGETAAAYQRDAYLTTNKHLPEQIVLDICIGASKGLEAAHRKGVIHRDIKPDNIMIPYTRCDETQRRSQTPLNFEKTKLMDLGLARKESRDKPAQRSNFTMGTPGFMSPEQMIDASSVGKPADVFGMGATMFSLLTNELPNVKKTTQKSAFKKSKPKFKPIRMLRPDLSEPVARLIDSCLAIQPESRPADASALLKELLKARSALDPSYNGHYSGEWPLED